MLKRETQTEQIEQLYFTWSATGYGDIPGFRLRAASPGVNDINGTRYSTLIPYLNYYLPVGTDPYEATAEASPRCLIYAKAGEDYILAQKVYTGKDTHGRPGAYFIHLLAGLLENFVARDAIRLWKSSLWKAWSVAEDKLQGVGLDLPCIAPTTLLGEHDQQDGSPRFLASDLQSFFSQVIQAYLMLKEEQKLYIIGTPDQVEGVIWVLTHSLPRTMQRDLTFSTYEQDVLKAAVRIVGTCAPQTALLRGYTQQSVALPPACYSQGSVIDCEKRQVTSGEKASADAIDYASFAIECLVHRNRTQELAAFLRKEEQAATRTIKTLLFHFTIEDKVSGRKPLPREDTLEFFKGDKESQYLYNERVREILIRSALAEYSWWNNQAKPAIQQRFLSDVIKKAMRELSLWVIDKMCITDVRKQPANWMFLFTILQDILPFYEEDNTPWLQLFNDKRAQTALISLALINPTWWEEQVVSIIQNFSQTKNAALSLRAFGKAIATELFQAMVLQQTNQITIMLSMLRIVTPPDYDNVPGIQLLEHCQEQMNKDESFHPTTAFDWNTRIALLSQWILCYWAYEQERQNKKLQRQPGLFWNMPIREEIVYPWLCLKNWDEFKDILDNIENYKKQKGKSNQNGQKREGNVFPSQWFNIAFTDLLLRSDEKTLPDWTIDLFKPGAHYSDLMSALMDMMELSKQQPAVLLYFRKLVKSRYKDIPLVLVMLTSAGSLSDEMTEQFFAAAQLNSNKKTELLENYLIQLLPGDSSPALPDIVALIDNYLQRLTLGLLAGKNALTINHTLQFLRTRQAKLPAPIRSKVDSWIRICVPLHMQREELQALNKAIIDLNLHKNKDFKSYKERLFQYLIEHITHKDQLYDVLDCLSPALEAGNWQALFHQLVVRFGKSYTPNVPYTLFVPYISMALSFYKKLKQKSDEDRKNFWNLYIEPLFKRVDSKTLAQVGQAISSGPYFQEWIELVNSNKPRRKQSQFAKAGQFFERAIEDVGEIAVDVAVNLLEAAAQQIVGVPPQQFIQEPPHPALSQQDDLRKGEEQKKDQAPQVGDERSPGRASLIQRRQTSSTASIVNGQHVSQEFVGMVYALKDLYIRMRLVELGEIQQEEMSKPKYNIAWIEDEQNELWACQTQEDTLRMLENDIFITQAIEQHHLHSEQYLEYVGKQIQDQANEMRVFGQYSHQQVQQVLQVFLRYRTLSYFFRQQGTVSLHEWLERQRAQADIQRQ